MFLTLGEVKEIGKPCSNTSSRPRRHLNIFVKIFFQ